MATADDNGMPIVFLHPYALVGPNRPVVELYPSDGIRLDTRGESKTHCCGGMLGQDLTTGGPSSRAAAAAELARLAFAIIENNVAPGEP